MASSTDLKNKLVRLISENLGQNTATLYDQFYHPENPERLLTAAEDLLSKMLGRKKAVEKLKPYFVEFNMATKHA